jgi:methyltransferase (TIGR00027 family)
MRKDQSSLTAGGVALVRAAESKKPAGERICYDPYAHYFVPAWINLFFGATIPEWISSEVYAFLVARDRYIDDVLQKALENNLEQLVILGAGYDTRAYRFDLQSQVKTFEVDYPATQQDKQAKLSEIFRKVPEHVTFVPIDFNKQSLKECLMESGYDPQRKTLFIWQGVTLYLTADAVDSTLDFVVKHSAVGSMIVFDYVYHAILDGTQKHAEVTHMHRYLQSMGEGITFGIPKGSVKTFLKDRGFNQVEDINAAGLKQIYFTGKNATQKVADAYGIATGVKIASP